MSKKIYFANIIIAEDRNFDNFYPFSLLHSIWELRFGYYMQFEKTAEIFPDTPVHFSGREDRLLSFFARFRPDSSRPAEGRTLIINAALLVGPDFGEILAEKSEESGNEIFMIGGKPAAVAVDKADYKPEKFFEDYLPNPEISRHFDISEKVRRAEYLWDALDYAGKGIEDDLKHLRGFYNFNPADYESVSCINPDSVFVGEGTSIAPGAVLDASKGPIILGPGTKIMPQATLIGPLSFGERCTIKVGAKIYEDCIFGKHCKIGGELENTIIQSYSNKQHDGFLGHSYICEWVNLGADTNNSDLKNNYSEITVNLNGKEVKTGRMFLGLLCGDHSKSGINTMFNTGTVCGVAGILVRDWFLPKFIPSFSWGGGKNSPKYKLGKALETARIVMGRRNKELLPEEERLLREIWSNTPLKR